jgi:lactoylglutathione lyase
MSFLLMAQQWIFEKRITCVELTHNWGTENQPDFKYANGNTESQRGFGHLAV